jgi:septum formation protein
MRLILASNSPRRREILALAGLDFDILPAEVDERWLSGEEPIDYVTRVAGDKARAVSRMLTSSARDGVLILAADTTVAVDWQVLAKPVDADQAEQMLRILRGRWHQVHTAMKLLHLDDGSWLGDLCTTEVLMRGYSDADMQAYITSGDPLDKAGAYGIQHTGFDPVEMLRGCHANVMGLPLCHLRRMLEVLGIPMPKAPQMACQGLIGTPCLVFEQYVQRELPIWSESNL